MCQQYTVKLHDDNCDKLHICKYELKNEGCKALWKCKLDHTFDTKHNKKILERLNLNNVNLKSLILIHRVSLFEYCIEILIYRLFLIEIWKKSI